MKLGEQRASLPGRPVMVHLALAVRMFTPLLTISKPRKLITVNEHLKRSSLNYWLSMALIMIQSSFWADVSPLRGWVKCFARYPWLAPWATDLCRSAAHSILSHFGISDKTLDTGDSISRPAPPSGRSNFRRCCQSRASPCVRPRSRFRQSIAVKDPGDCARLCRSRPAPAQTHIA